MLRRFVKTSLIALSAFTVLATGGCSTDKGLPTAAMDPKLAAQHQANLAAIETERQASNARYDSLMTVWKSRASGQRPMTAAGDSTFAVIPCAPLPFSGSAQIVGPAGGVFYFGPHKLVVPAGALSEEISIAVMVKTTLETQVELLPHGTQFSVPVKLKLAYSQCVPAATHNVAYVDGNGGLLEWTPVMDFPTYNFVVASLNHFSTYAVAY
jgi:hypothetical protein